MPMNEYQKRRYHPHPYVQQQPYNNPYIAPMINHVNQESIPPPTPFAMYAKPKQPSQMQQPPHAFYQTMQQQTPKPNNSLIAYFQDQNGQIDYGKMLSTVSQVATTFQQVTPVIQQINAIIKSFR